MGEKKNTDGENSSSNNNVVLKVDMHCQGCASKIIRYLRAFPGVETVKAESETGKITITGKVDPTKVKEKLGGKMKKKVELLSPQPKKENKDNNNNNNNNKKQQQQGEKKTEDNKKTKENDKEPPVTTAVLKVALHCHGCLDRISKTVLKTKGVHGLSIDKEKELVTVKGTMDVKALAGNLMEKLKRKVEVVPPKNDKKDNGGGGGGNKEGPGKKNKGGGGGDGNNEDGGGNKMMEQNMMMMEHLAVAPPPPFGYGYGPHGFGYGGYGGYGGGGNAVGGYTYVPVHLHAPQMFSDENPNACSVM